MEALDIKLVVVRELLQGGRLEEAFNEISLLLPRFPESGRLQALHGQVLFRYLGHFDQAEEAFRKAMRSDGDDPALYPEYAALLLQGGKYTEVVAVLNRAMEVPLVAKEKIFALFGQLYERQQNWEEAIEYYSKAALFTLDTDEMEQFLADRQRVARKKAM
jgi:tetratricopeptide (TPR) repeat protein